MSENADRLHSAAHHFQHTSNEVGGDGGIARQVGDGVWDEALEEKQLGELADLFDVASERVKFTRALVPDPSTPNPSGPSDQAPGDWLPMNRKERYYTGTVLPMLVASDGFAHLHRLLKICGLKVDKEEVYRGLADSGHVRFYTEYGFAESVFTDADRAEWPDVVAADTPDVVITGPDWLVAIEAKMFHNPNAASLRAQMKRQQVLVEMWASKRRLDPARVKHVLLLPRPLADRVGNVSYPVVTWEDVLVAYTAVGPRHWSYQLARALKRHPELESRAAITGTNAHSVMTGQEIVDAYAAGTLVFDHVGRSGGLHKTAFTSDVSTGGWRTTRYEVRTGTLPGNNNWFTVTDFLAATVAAHDG